MIKKTLLYASLLLFTTSLFAQKEDKFQFGFYGGLTHAVLKNVDNQNVLESQKGVWGLHGGVIGQCDINSKWAMNFMTGLNTKGTKWEQELFFANAAWRLYYFSVIPQIRHKFNRMYVEFGPEFAHLVLHQELELGQKWVKSSFPFVKKRDFAMQVGLGVKINRQSSIVLRYSHSLLNISDSLPGDFGDFKTNDYFKNQIFQFSYQTFAF